LACHDKLKHIGHWAIGNRQLPSFFFSLHLSSLNPFGQPDNRNGTYKNPIIFADYSDPDVVRVGDDFYLTSSSFNSAPGLPYFALKRSR
jgi:hypothetical protein